MKNPYGRHYRDVIKRKRQKGATYGRTKAERIKWKRELVDSLGGKCVDCGYSAHLAALDFDHTDPTTKEYEIGTMLGNKKFDYLNILMEARKCVIRCANCHRIKTNPTATD